MNKKLFGLLVLMLGVSSEFACGLGVGVDTIQAGMKSPSSKEEFAKINLEEKQDVLNAAQERWDFFLRVLKNKSAGEPITLTAPMKFYDVGKGQDMNAMTLSEIEEYANRAELDLLKAKAQVTVAKEELEEVKADENSVTVDPKVEAGGDQPSASINFRYTHAFERDFFLTGAVDIGSMPDASAEKLAAAFAMNGGNVDFSLKVGWIGIHKGRGGELSFRPDISYTYSALTATELDVDNGGIAEVDTEIQSLTIGFTLGFQKQFFLSADLSHHDVSGKGGSEFHDLLDNNTSFVVRAIFATDAEQKRFLVLERAHPIGDESAQLRLAFVVSLDL